MDKPHEPLAKNLCAAYLATSLGVTLNHARKAYVQDDVAEFWYRLAETVERWNQQNMAAHMAQILPQ